MPIFAVHISNGVLQPAWMVGGFVALALAVGFSLRKIDDREIPRLGVLTAAFFVASSLTLPLFGTSVHFLLNGLVGVVARMRSALVVVVGLTLQTLLLSHGGLTALGINFVVLAFPALLGGLAFPPLARRLPPFSAGLLIGLGTATLTVLLNATVLWFGSIDTTGWIAGASLLVHLPFIVVEGFGVGFAARVLAKAKPDWLGLPIQPVRQAVEAGQVNDS